MNIMELTEWAQDALEIFETYPINKNEGSSQN